MSGTRQENNQGAYNIYNYYSQFVYLKLKDNMFFQEDNNMLVHFEDIGNMLIVYLILRVNEHRRDKKKV